MPRPHVLLIDDDPLCRRVVSALLRNDFRIAEAGSGIEGLESARNAPPDLAVIDVQMPGWSGLQTVSAFRSDRDLTSVPVIMLTSDASQATVDAATQAGAQDYIIKAFLTRDELVQKIESAITAAAERDPNRPWWVSLHPASTVDTPQVAAALDNWE